jgi:hypothetical protein
MVGPLPEALPNPSVPTPIEEKTDRLVRGLDYEARFAEPSRNLFRFHEGAIALEDQEVVPTQNGEATSVVSSLSTPEETLALVGIASDLVENETVRTAILRVQTRIVLAGIGETVTEGFQVRAIGPDSIELARESDGLAFTLLLKP